MPTDTRDPAPAAPAAGHRAYRLLFRLVLSRVDPERAHRLAFAALRGTARLPGVRALAARVLAPRHDALRITALGMDLPGPLGLAAGFDKNATGLDALTMAGFDYVEAGTVTGQPQPGNPAPRLFRLPADRALVNRMGFNNDGSAAVQRRLATRRPVFDAHVGLNIGRTKAAGEDGALADYTASAERLAPHADYLVVNVSSPNTPGLRDLQATAVLRPLLEAVRAAADRAGGPGGRRVPLLVKIAPDLADEDIDAVADLAVDLGLDGVIATNTTIGRGGLATPERQVADTGAGGLSGPPLADRSLAVLRRLHARAGDRLVLISAGGITTADDAWRRVLAGATLVQAYTAFVYRGPFWPRSVRRGLAARLRDSPHATLADAVGADARKADTA